MERKIITFGNHFKSFIDSVDDSVRRKIDYVLDMLKTLKRINSKFVKLIKDGVYELRVEWDGNIYRVFFIFDEGNIVVLFNGFQKKTRKTPQSEIEKALKIKEEYYEYKRKHDSKEAYAFYMGQVISEARKEEKITQTELGKRIGANKSYISRIENGLIDPTISTLYSIISALGLRIEIVKPLG